MGEVGGCHTSHMAASPQVFAYVQKWPVGKAWERRTVGINWPALGKVEEEHQLDLSATPHSSKPRRPPSVVLRGLLFAHSLNSKAHKVTERVSLVFVHRFSGWLRERLPICN